MLSLVPLTGDGSLANKREQQQCTLPPLRTRPCETSTTTTSQRRTLFSLVPIRSVGPGQQERMGVAACLGHALYVVPPVRAQAHSRRVTATERDSFGCLAAFHQECGIGNVMVPTKSCWLSFSQKALPHIICVYSSRWQVAVSRKKALQRRLLR